MERELASPGLRDGAHLLSTQEPKPWSSGTFACLSDADSCCLACWCPCIAFGQNQERAFRSQHRTCFRWALVWTTPLLIGYSLLLVLRSATGKRECKIVCHHVDGGLREASSSIDLSGVDLQSDCFKYCPFVQPVWVDVVEMFVWIVALLAIAVVAGRRRALLRSQHRIRGSIEHDVACHCLCGCCSLAQEARQIACEEARARRVEPSGVPSYVHAHLPMPPAGTPSATMLAQPAFAYVPSEAHHDYSSAVATPALAQPIAQPVSSAGSTNAEWR